MNVNVVVGVMEALGGRMDALGVADGMSMEAVGVLDGEAVRLGRGEAVSLGGGSLGVGVSALCGAALLTPHANKWTKSRIPVATLMIPDTEYLPLKNDISIPLILQF